MRKLLSTITTTAFMLPVMIALFLSFFTFLWPIIGVVGLIVALSRGVQVKEQIRHGGSLEKVSLPRLIHAKCE